MNGPTKRPFGPAAGRSTRSGRRWRVCCRSAAEGAAGDGCEMARRRPRPCDVMKGRKMTSTKRTRMLAAALKMVVPALLATAVVTAQTPAGQRSTPPRTPTQTQVPPVYRAGANVITLDVTPRDPTSGAFDPGLTQDDFQVFEDGVEQKITAFLY